MIYARDANLPDRRDRVRWRRGARRAPARRSRRHGARARQRERSQNAGGLEEAKRRFYKISQPSEAARLDYVTRLVRMREEMARQKNDEWKAIDSEIREHPAPKDSDGNVLSRRLVGKWSSPRHDYL